MAPLRSPFRLAVALAACFSAAACGRMAELVAPTPITLETPIGFTTRWRLLQATSEPAACQAWLAQAGVAFRPVADRAVSEFCTVTAAGAVSDLGAPGLRFSPARPMMSCQLAAALALWRRQSVEPAAEELLGASVKEIDHLGVYACRPVAGAAGLEGRPSAHARAAAIDVAGFRLSDGRRISVQRDWASDGPEGRFLHRIRDDACRIFGATLSPDYNPAHASHLHLEIGLGGACA
jgi:hypothetical protein